ncbi:MAG: DNA polymerase III subunit delta, partial [Verrucomicrobia bacterium]|nr:DNA polymerase III subunit delta [Verrucomicrobiota bacterium]
MASKAPIATVSLYLFAGEDDFAVKQHARQLFQKWCAEVGGFDHERIDAFALNSGEAFRAISSLREAMQTLPFFGGGKVIWWDNCSFLGDDRTGSSSGVTEALQELAQELKAFRWDGVRLIISAGKVDKRKVFYKALDKLGSVEFFEGWSA